MKIHNYNVMMYFALDFVTYVEYGQYIQKDMFYYENLFLKIKNSKPSEAKAVAQMIQKTFEEFQLKEADSLYLAQHITNYVEMQHLDKKEATLRARFDGKGEEERVKAVS